MACTSTGPNTWSTTPDRTSVDDCVNNQAASGDTINIQAGSATWSTPINISKALHILGSPCTTDAFDIPTSGGCGTVITDAAEFDNLINWTLEANKAHEFGHVKFVNGRASGYRQGTTFGIISIVGNMSAGQTMHWHHTYVDHLRFTAFWVDTVRGRFDHNHIAFEYIGGVGAGNIYGGGHNFSGSSDTMGHQSYHDMSASKWGSLDFTVWEDNILTYDSPSAYAGFDSHRGFRGVYRFNKLVRCEPEAHGTDSGGGRGTVAIETYGNIFDVDSYVQIYGMQGQRSGSVIAWGNTFLNRPLGFGPGRAFMGVIDRICAYMTFGEADGENQWDVNSGSNPFYSCASCVSAGGSLQVTVSPDPSWTNNQWAGYVVHNTSCSAPSNCSSIILSNDNNTLFFNGDEGHPPGGDLTFAAGDGLKINLVLAAMDGPSLTGGDLQSGSDWTLMTPAGSFPNQIILPSYEWLNYDDAAGAYVHSTYHSTSTGLYNANVHFFNYVPSGFDGTVGVGVGDTIADAPSTCTENVGFWAKTEGTWKKSVPPLTGYADQGVFYKCGSSDNWVPYYTPVEYPYPLGAEAPPATSIILMGQVIT